jgi:CRISPR-associated protein Cas5/CasD subtype I-E
VTRAVGCRFRLAVPLVSWSESGAATRATDFVPSWSAITGMCGAAFGWKREDPRLVRLAAEYALAVAVKNPGQRLEDYHTVQSPEASQASRLRVRTRADELSVAAVHTTITRREYVAGAEYEILIIQLTENPIVLPQQIVSALATPAFPLYAGRRSCVVGRLTAEYFEGEIDQLLSAASHWDARLNTSKAYTFVRERRDLLVGNRQFASRNECAA